MTKLKQETSEPSSECVRTSYRTTAFTCTYKICKDFYEVQSLCDIRSDCFLHKQYRQAAETAQVKSDLSFLGHNMAANFTKDRFSHTDLKIMNHFYMHHLLLLEVKSFFLFFSLYYKK